MRKNITIRILCSLIAVIMLAVCLAGCSGNSEEPKNKDFASSVKLDESSNTKKVTVTVKNFVDGDTTHFNVPDSLGMPANTLKARYLAVNTPESTGKIEEYGKKASEFTKSKLSSAVSIVVESDDDSWNLDSTGSRYMVWIWYKTAEDTEYRNLNIEILQNGLAIAVAFIMEKLWT